MKFLFKLLKIFISLLFLGLSVLILLFTLNEFNVIDINFDWLENVSWWTYVEQAKIDHKFFYISTLIGSCLLTLFISGTMVISIIPILGKALSKVIKVVFGSSIISISIVLIIIGILGCVFSW